MIVLYGINNCDSVKKAKKWLDHNQIDYQFYDVRKQPLAAKTIKGWINDLGWERVVNKRSTSWKQLAPSLKDTMNDTQAVDAIIDQPTLFKRPLVTKNEHVLTTGFNISEYEERFLGNA